MRETQKFKNKYEAILWAATNAQAVCVVFVEGWEVAVRLMPVAEK